MAASTVGIGGGSLFGKVLTARTKNKNENKNKIRRRVMCVSSYRTSSLTEQYKTLRIQPGSSEMEVKKAFRQLALQYHPDVCNGKNSGVHFSRINEAYHVVMNNLRNSPEVMVREYDEDEEVDDELWYDESNWELWNEYSTQFNNYNI
ncbi:Chaperone protein dnaJ [Zostera marina]|uniref:Chaperone protein dnaJ n=1 Tax=Zostera marina TaxID=29655 RepID=A0A0K9P8I3_ZOSMR|nr:Chaperone protein dnaJ [Zostera marina]